MARNLTSGLRRGLRRSIAGGLGAGDIFTIAPLDLRFAQQKALDSRITFTRSSRGTFVGSDGLIKTATTNLLLRSEEFDNASWVKLNSTITANAITAPNGTLTADKLIADNGTTLNGGDSAGSVSQSVAGTSAIPYVYSFYAKAAEISSVRVRETVTTGARAIINLSTGAVSYESGSSSSFTVSAVNVGDEWWRIALFRTPATTLNFVIKPGSTTGDGTSGIYLWGAQLEQSSTVGEYIPTTSTINSAPRFDHNPTTGESLGLLVEEQRTNFALNTVLAGGTTPTSWSLGSTGVPTVASSIYGNGDGGIALSFATNIDRNYITQTVALAANTTYVFSVLVESVVNYTSTNANIISLNNAPAGSTITGASGNPAVGQRITTTIVVGATAGNVQIRIGLGVGSNATGTIILSRPQLEAGSFPTSYIPTTTATVTRSADVASITGANFSTWYRQDEGTVFAENSQSVTSGDVAYSYYMDAGAGLANSIYSDVTSGNRRGVVFTGNVVQCATNFGAISANTQAKTAFALKQDQFGLVLNGGTVASDSSGTVPSGISRMSLGNNTAASAAINGTIRRLTYWPQRLPNSTLQEITR